MTGVRNVKQYQIRPEDVAELAWDRGYLKAWGLFRVAAWKSAKGLAPLCLNTEEDIEQRSRSAMAAIAPLRDVNIASCTDEGVWRTWLEAAWAAIGDKRLGTGLLGLRGVGYPMATAVLDVLDPKVWPVIDKWAVQTVFGHVPEVKWKRGVAYQAYARHLAAKGSVCWGTDLSIHELDLRAMSAAGGTVPANWTTAVLPD